MSDRITYTETVNVKVEVTNRRIHQYLRELPSAVDAISFIRSALQSLPEEEIYRTLKELDPAMRPRILEVAARFSEVAENIQTAARCVDYDEAHEG